MGVTPTDLTGTERAVLLVLMAESRPLPNPELIALGPKLEKSGRDKLNRLGLIESMREGRRLVHELTDRGWHLCREIASAGPPPHSTGPTKTLYTVLGSLDRYLTRADVSLADVFGSTDESPPTGSIEDRIRDAYAALTPRPGGWVSLARLRIELADAAAAEIDAALRTLYRTPGVSLIPEENQQVLTVADREAAVMIGDQHKHLIAIEL